MLTSLSFLNFLVQVPSVQFIDTKHLSTVNVFTGGFTGVNKINFKSMYRFKALKSANRVHGLNYKNPVNLSNTSNAEAYTNLFSTFVRVNMFTSSNVLRVHPS